MITKDLLATLESHRNFNSIPREFETPYFSVLQMPYKINSLRFRSVLSIPAFRTDTTYDSRCSGEKKKEKPCHYSSRLARNLYSSARGTRKCKLARGVFRRKEQLVNEGTRGG